MTYRIIALISGLIFGAGMMFSGMVDPQRVIGFLDITGAWDPSLAFVMGGGLLVFMPIYLFYIRHKVKPVCAEEFKVTKNNQLDKPLVIGAALFGLGWGIAGICPGPAITSLGSADLGVILFIVSMIVGSFLGQRFSANKA